MFRSSRAVALAIVPLLSWVVIVGSPGTAQVSLAPDCLTDPDTKVLTLSKWNSSSGYQWAVSQELDSKKYIGVQLQTQQGVAADIQFGSVSSRNTTPKLLPLDTTKTIQYFDVSSPVDRTLQIFLTRPALTAEAEVSAVVKLCTAPNVGPGISTTTSTASTTSTTSASFSTSTSTSTSTTTSTTTLAGVGGTATLVASPRCPSGFAVKPTGVTPRSTGAGSWAVPARLIDTDLANAWAPNLAGEKVEVTFGGPFALGGIVAHSWATGNVGISVVGGANPPWVLPPMNGSGWQPLLPTNGTVVNSVTVEATIASGNVNELVFCEGSDPGPSSTTTTSTTSSPSSSTSTTIAPTTGTVDLFALKTLLPEQMNPPVPVSGQYDDLRKAVMHNYNNWDAITTTAGAAEQQWDSFKFSWIKGHPVRPTLDCIDRHNKYWTKGPDGKAYNTWHPSTDVWVDGNGKTQTCHFGHEHGMDPAKSDLLVEFGGMPPFGYVLEQHHEASERAQLSMHRHEDHVGHKVSFKNGYTAAWGNTADDKPVRATDYQCSIISKLHQGSHSDDAFTNQLHEYFVAVKCNDFGKPNTVGTGLNATIGTFFSVKMLVPFGNANEFKDANKAVSGNPPAPFTDWDPVIWQLGGKSIRVKAEGSPAYPANVVTGLPKGRLASSVGSPLKPLPESPVQEEIVNIKESLAPPNNREFAPPPGWDQKDVNVTTKGRDALSQIDLWSQITDVQTPKLPGTNNYGHIGFGAYYIVKNPVRYFDVDYAQSKMAVSRTIDLCWKEVTPTTFVFQKGKRYCTSSYGLAPDQSLDNRTAKPLWFDGDSPFNGTLRAINFKALTIENEGGQTSFCTNVYGKTPTLLSNGTCADGSVLQRASAFRNNANGGRCYIPAGYPCSITGSTENALVNSDGTFAAQGLGFEFIIDNRFYTQNPDFGDPAGLTGTSGAPRRRVIFGEN
jgi:hypothetical protein